MPLRLIGYWKATLSDELPLPQNVEVEMDPLLRDRTASYLEAGDLFEDYRGVSWCRCGCKGPNGSKELTDGTWVWPEGLAHYVREHRIGLPPDFLRHVAHPVMAWLQGKAHRHFRARTVDQGLWLTWSKQFRSEAFDQRLRDARASVERVWEETLQATAARLAGERGVRGKRCLKTGCEATAIGGLELCGRCCAEQIHSHLLPRLETEELHRLLTAASMV